MVDEKKNVKHDKQWKGRCPGGRGGWGRGGFRRELLLKLLLKESITDAVGRIGVKILTISAVIETLAESVHPSSTVV